MADPGSPNLLRFYLSDGVVIFGSDQTILFRILSFTAIHQQVGTCVPEEVALGRLTRAEHDLHNGHIHCIICRSTRLMLLPPKSLGR